MTKEKSSVELKSPVGLKASYRGELRGPDGKVKQVVENKNIIVDDGLDEVMRLVGNVTGGIPFEYIAMGIDSTAHTYASHVLNNEPATGTFRKSATTSISQNADGSVPQGSVLRLQCTYAPGEATGALVESGIFNVAIKADTGEEMLAADTFAVINKGASDTLTWTWEVTLQRV